MQYFIADTHFKHQNILKLSNRPFATIEEHDEALIKNWNDTVKPDDEIYILGDFTMSRKGKDANALLSRLNGKKYLIKGNHEHYLNDPEFDMSNYEWVKDYFELRYDKIQFVLFHYPILEWNGFFQKSLHLYGHVHNTREDYFTNTLDARAVNVGVDMTHFKPIAITELVEYLNTLETPTR